MLLSLLTLSLSEVRADPGRVVATLDDAAGTALDQIVVVPGWPIAGVIGADSTLRVVDLETWQTLSVALCDGGAPAGIAARENSGAAEIFTGCDDGSVGLTTITADGDVTHTQGAVALDGAVLALVVDDTALWAVYDAGDNAAVSEIDPSTLEIPSAGVSGELGRAGCAGAVLTSGLVLVAHGDDDVSRFDTSTGNASLSAENLGGRDFVDIELAGVSYVFLADYAGALLRYNLSGNVQDNYQILLDEANGLVAPSAVLIDADGEWLALADTQVGNLIVFGYDSGSGSPNDQVEWVIDLGDTSKVADLRQYESWILASTEDGELAVITEVPWVTVSNAPTETFSAGDSLSLDFFADQSADWEVRLFEEDADAYASGSFGANELTSVDLTVYESWAEGANRVYVVAESGGLVGRTAVDVWVDNPPERIEDLTVGFGNEKVIVSFSGPGAADLATYEVYISTEPFAADDYETGGPAYVGPDRGISSPISYTVTDPDADFEATIDGLTNDVVYYVGVRAVDEGGTEGDMSEVKSATPKLTTGAAGLAGEEGGLGCGFGGRGAFLPAALAAMLLARRRAALALVLLAPLTAQAADAQDGEIKGHKGEDGKLHADRNSEVRVGQQTFTSDEIQSVYGDQGLIRMDLESGIQLVRVLELDAGLGLVRREGYQVDPESGTSSTDVTKLTLIPLSLSATARLDFFDGQPIVPYGSFGLDYWLWRERLGELSTDTMFNIDHVGGDKLGYHYALGANILLDWMEPDRAGTVAARWGIHDSYLTVDWRRNAMLESGLSFAGSTITVGVKVDR